MILRFRRCDYRNPAEIIEALGLTWGENYRGMAVNRDEIEGISIDCPDEIADDVRDLIEPYRGKVAYATSVLKGLTQEQLEQYIDNNVTNLVEAKAYLKKLSAVVLYLVKHTGMDR